MELFDVIGLSNGDANAMNFLMMAKQSFGNSPVLTRALNFVKNQNIRGRDLNCIHANLCNSNIDLTVYTLMLADKCIIDPDLLKEGSTFQDHRIKDMIDVDIVNNFMDKEVTRGED